MDYSQMRTWAECSETTLCGNIREIKKLLGNSKLLGVVKANAYGHGAVKTAEILAHEGACGLAVATLSEAIELREAGISLPVLVLGPTEPSFFDELIAYNLTQTVADIGFAEMYNKAAERTGKRLGCHMKIDTGMGRLGFTEPDEMIRAALLKGLNFEGAFTHFAISDMPGESGYTLSQLERFKGFVRVIERQAGMRFRFLHAANSGGIQNFPQSHLDMARPGIILYGYPAIGSIYGIEPVMELKTRIVQVKHLKKGDSVSYGRRFIADKPTRVAVLPIGYADGLSRTLTNRLSVLVNGKKAAQTGTICMDMCMIDVTDLPEVQAGSAVTVLGREKGFTAGDMAELRDTIPYEVLCNISGRVPRVWVE